MEITTSQIAKVLQAEYQGPVLTCTNICIDSRVVKPKSLFIAIKGPHHDGHDFIEQCEKLGAVAVVVNHPVSSHLPQIIVKDTRLALGELAHWWRQQHQIDLVAITGSCGKTTTKNLIANILEPSFQTLANQGTFNNDYGVPLTLLQLDSHHECAIIEMGANHAGEIAYLSQLAHPNVAVLTGVYPVHLEGFGSLANIAKAKAEIFQGLDEQGVAIIKRDDEFYSYWQNLLKGKKIISFGFSQQADIYATDIQSHDADRIKFNLHFPTKTLPVVLPLLGEHNVLNALAASAACYALDIVPEVIQIGLQTITPEPKRLVKELGKAGYVVIDDSYSANPTSFAAALNVLSKQAGEKIVVMGDMAELGDESLRFHRELAQKIKESGAQHLYAIGDFSRYTVEEFGKNAFHFTTQDELIEKLTQDLQKKHCVLVKGSRCMRMENIVAALVEKS